MGNRLRQERGSRRVASASSLKPRIAVRPAIPETHTRPFHFSWRSRITTGSVWQASRRATPHVVPTPGTFLLGDRDTHPQSSHVFHKHGLPTAWALNAPAEQTKGGSGGAILQEWHVQQERQDEAGATNRVHQDNNNSKPSESNDRVGSHGGNLPRNRALSVINTVDGSPNTRRHCGSGGTETRRRNRHEAPGVSGDPAGLWDLCGIRGPMIGNKAVTPCFFWCPDRDSNAGPSA